MSKADIFRATLDAQLGEPYVLGDEGPNTHDCSGLHYEGMRAAGVLWKGKAWPRETANDYKNKAVPADPPYRVGWPVFFSGKSGHAYHVASITEVDPDGRNGWTVEARGRKFGVVRYRISDPVNGVLARGGKVYRYPGIDLGGLTEDDMTEDEIRAIVREEVDIIYSVDVARAQQHLVRLGILAKERAADKAASVGFVALMASRVLKTLGKL